MSLDHNCVTFGHPYLLSTLGPRLADDITAVPKGLRFRYVDVVRSELTQAVISTITNTLYVLL